MADDAKFVQTPASSNHAISTLTLHVPSLKGLRFLHNVTSSEVIISSHASNMLLEIQGI